MITFDFWSFCLLSIFIYNTLVASSGNNEYKSHSDITAKWKFIDRNSFPIAEAPFASSLQSPSKQYYKIPMKQTTAILLSLRNSGDSSFNITSISGNLHAAHRYSFHVQSVCSIQISFHKLQFLEFSIASKTKKNRFHRDPYKAYYSQTVRLVSNISSFHGMDLLHLIMCLVAMSNIKC